MKYLFLLTLVPFIGCSVETEGVAGEPYEHNPEYRVIFLEGYIRGIEEAFINELIHYKNTTKEEKIFAEGRAHGLERGHKIKSEFGELHSKSIEELLEESRKILETELKEIKNHPKQ